MYTSWEIERGSLDETRTAGRVEIRDRGGMMVSDFDIFFENSGLDPTRTDHRFGFRIKGGVREWFRGAFSGFREG